VCVLLNNQAKIINQNYRQTYPLSCQQRNIWHLEQVYSGIPINNICGNLKIEGRLDIALLEQSINILLEHDDTLRTRLTMIDGEVRQYTAKFLPKPIDFFDFTTTRKNGLFQWDIAISRQVFPMLNSDLFYFAIFKTDEKNGGIFVKTHHIISDGFSQALITNRIAENYMKLLAKESPDIQDSPTYFQYLEKEEDYFVSERHKKDLEFWNQKMQTLPSLTGLKEYSYSYLSPVGSRKTYVMPAKLSDDMLEFCLEHRVTLFSVFQLALCIYVNRMTGHESFVIGVPIVNRTSWLEKNTTGMFVSTVPLIIEVAEKQSVAEFTKSILTDWYEILRHQKLPYDEILNLARKYNGQTTRLFDLTLSYQNSVLFNGLESKAAMEGRWHYSGYQGESLCIHISNRGGDNRIIVDYDYLTQVFSPKEIDYIHSHLLNILTDALAHPDKPLADIEIMDDEEKERVIYTYNSNTKPYDKKATINQIIESAAQKYPQKPAIISEGGILSYADLLLQADDLAQGINANLFFSGDQSQKSNKTIAVVLDKGPDLFVAMLGILQAGHCMLLIDPKTPDKRRKYLLEDSKASLIISSAVLSRFLKLAKDNVPQFLIDDSKKQGYLNFFTSQGKPKDLAYIIYTSGTTGWPKGVGVEHTSLINFAEGMKDIFADNTVLSLTMVGFDAFMLESLVPLMHGCSVVITPSEKENDPDVLAELMLEHQVGLISLTPSRLKSYTKNSGFLQAASSLKSIICGGESFPADLLAILKENTNAQVYNQYGPTEATVGVTLASLTDSANIDIGKPMPNCQVYILDRNRKALPVGVPGEIYIGGDCLARGYINNPDLNAQSFVPNPFNPKERLYKTGDLARWYPQGAIAFLGRADNQVKIRGFRVEPNEVAACISYFPGVDHVVVKVYEDKGGQNYLCAYYTSPEAIDIGKIKDFVALYLPQYMVPAFIERIEILPLTPNGKVDYAALPEPNLAKQGQGAYEAPANIVEAQLEKIWAKILHADSISVTANYFQLGGNSLNVLEMIVEIHQVFQVSLKYTDVYANPSIRQLAELIMASDTGVFQPISPAPVLPQYPLSPAQKRLYVLYHMDPSKLSYNMPGVYRIRGPLDVKRLENAFKKLIARQEVLRTSFAVVDGDLAQYIAEEVNFELEVIAKTSLKKAMQDFVRPFCLSSPPLLRAGVMQQGPEDYFLFVDLHHIIFDGLSGDIFMEELDTLYGNGVLQPTSTMYKDYAYWFSQQEKGPLMQKQKEYWQQTFKDNIPVLDLPYDRPRPLVFDFKGEKITFTFCAPLSVAVNDFCEKNQVSPYMFFVAAYSILLAKMAGQEDIVIGSPTSGRRHKDLARLMGVFINTLPMYLKPRPQLIFTEYLAQVKQKVLEALDNQDFPFDRLVDLLEVDRDLTRNPFFSVIFAMQVIDAQNFSLADLKVENVPLDSKKAKVDLNLEAIWRKGAYHFTMEYATSLFDRETIETYLRSFTAIVEGIIADAARSIELLPWLHPDDKEKLGKANRSFMPYPLGLIDQIIDRQATAKPLTTAIEARDDSLSFQELSQKSTALANHLISLGAKKGDKIGLICRRHPKMIVALIAILKAGCAYVPIDPDYPESRKRYILNNSQAAILLCDGKTEVPAGLDMLVANFNYADNSPLSNYGRSTQDLMYILYTSGSTGQPKGVMVSHGSVANLMATMDQLIKQPGGKVLCTTNMVFDVFIAESLIPLAFGMSVVLADEEAMRLPWLMANLIESSRPEIMQLTPSRMQLCLTDKNFTTAINNMKIIILSGEKVPGHLVQKLLDATPANIINMYGPTETTVYATWANLTRADYLPIGKACANTRLYVLDENLQLLPPGARGQLYIAGPGVSMGYMGQPELTQKAFLPDPFYPGELMYKSGDIVRQLPNGDLDFLGRQDNQIKMHGLRIELEEIEAKIIESGLVKEAIVLPKKEADQVVSLCGYVVPKELSLSTELLREYLKEQLPEYMVPGYFISLDSLPLTSSGKVDGRALAKLSLDLSSPILSAGIEEVPPKTKIPITAASTTTPVLKTATASVEAPILQASQTASEPLPTPLPQTSNLEEGMLAVWRQVLNKQNIDPQQNFFELGGDSMRAIIALSQYFAANWPLSFEEFYANPTIKAQVKLIEKAKGLAVPPAETIKEEVDESLEFSKENEAAIPEVLIQADFTPPMPEIMAAKEAVPAQLQPQPQPPSALPSYSIYPAASAELFPAMPQAELARVVLPQQVFITGGTGFLGAHIIYQLLTLTQSQVVVLVRGGSLTRLEEVLTFYFGPYWFRKNAYRLKVADGDITLPLLGMAAKEYERLAKKTDVVIHAAADVRHYGQSKVIMANNVLGSQNVIDFAHLAEAHLCHVSTTSVAGEYLPAEPERAVNFTEADFYIGQNWQDNLYVKSKFLAENRVINAMEAGLSASIFRVGRLVGRHEDGVFQINEGANAFYSYMQAIMSLGAIPQNMQENQLELTGVDLCAKALVRIIIGGALAPAYHLFNPHYISPVSILQGFGEKPNILPEQQFQSLIKEKISTSTGPVSYGLIEMSQNNLFASQARPKINLVGDYTVNALKMCGFTWPKPDVEFLQKLYKHMQERGFF